MHALVHVHLTTANQSEIRKAYLVSVIRNEGNLRRMAKDEVCGDANGNVDRF
jgi:hypothetical protein